MSAGYTIYEHEPIPLSPVSGLTLSEELLLLGLKSNCKTYPGTLNSLVEATMVDLILHHKLREHARTTLHDTGAVLSGHPLAAYEPLLRETQTFKDWALRLPREIAVITAELLTRRDLMHKSKVKRGHSGIRKWPRLTSSGERLAQEIRVRYSAVLEGERLAQPEEALLLDIALTHLSPAVFARPGIQLRSKSFGEERPLWTQVTELALEVQEARAALKTAYTADLNIV